SSGRSSPCRPAGGSTPEPRERSAAGRCAVPAELSAAAAPLVPERAGAAGQRQGRAGCGGRDVRAGVGELLAAAVGRLAVPAVPAVNASVAAVLAGGAAAVLGIAAPAGEFDVLGGGAHLAAGDPVREQRGDRRGEPRRFLLLVAGLGGRGREVV